MWLLAPYPQLQTVELAMGATVVINDFGFSAFDHASRTHHHGHYIGADSACIILGTFVFECERLRQLIREEARTTVEGVDILRQTVPT